MMHYFLCLLALIMYELGLGDKGNREPRLKNFNLNLISTCNVYGVVRKTDFVSVKIQDAVFHLISRYREWFTKRLL